MTHPFVALLLLICLSPLSLAAVSVRPAEVSLVPAATIVRDATGQLAAEELVARPPAPPSATRGGEMASFGFTDAAYWFQVELDNPTGSPVQRLLTIDPTWLDDVRLTLVLPEGSVRSLRGGDDLPFAQRALPDRKINFELDLPPGRSRLLVRVRTGDPFLVGMTLWERSAFFAAKGSDAGYFGILYGAMGALLLFNLFLFLSVRERVYGAYVLYLAAFIAMHATYNGYAYGTLWPDSPRWGNWAHSVFIYLYLLGGIFFTVRFLELRQRLPLAFRWALAFLIALAVSFVATAALGGYRWHVRTSILWVVIYSPFVLLLGVWSWRAGNRAARYFLPATVAGFVGSLITAMTVSDLLPYSLAGYRAVDFGMLIDAILLSLALADRLRLARAEADRAKAELIETQRVHTGELEETVRQRTRELSEANTIKDKFFTIVAHDLRGPIGGLAALFDKSVFSRADLTEETLDVVRNSIGNIRDFLEELLTWARSQRGEIDYHPEPVDLGALLRETQALLSAQAHGKGIELDLHVAQPAWVVADPAMTRSVLRNLVQNALKFTDTGGAVRADVAREERQWRVTIADTGVGMSEEAMGRLFRLDVKFRSSPGTRREAGTGLGLVLCKEFVERNGGVIGVRSERGRGSLFSFTLPAADDARVAESMRPAPNAAAVNVLVVEDDKLSRDAAAYVLKKLGCLPAFAVDGGEAVRLASEAPFDFILMDIDLPDMSGIDAAERIRAAGSNARIVALSSYSRQEIVRMQEAVRFYKYLYKPLTEADAMALLALCTTAEPA